MNCKKKLYLNIFSVLNLQIVTFSLWIYITKTNITFLWFRSKWVSNFY